MFKTFVFALLFVFIFSGEVLPESGTLIPAPGTESVVIAAAQQVSPAPPTSFPKTDLPKLPAAPKPPPITHPPSGTAAQPHPSLVAARQMRDAVNLMVYQGKLHQKEMAKILQDITLMQNPMIKSRVAAIQANDALYQAQRLLQETDSLLKAVQQALNASQTQ